MQIFSIIVLFKIANSSIYVFLSRQVQLQLEPIRKNLHFLSSIFMLEFVSILFFNAMYPIAFLNDRMAFMRLNFTCLLQAVSSLDNNFSFIAFFSVVFFSKFFNWRSPSLLPTIRSSFFLFVFLFSSYYMNSFGRSHHQRCCIQFVRLLYRINKWYFPSYSEKYALQHGYMSFFGIRKNLLPIDPQIDINFFYRFIAF